ncbi:MAG: methylated-DNA--[protein]-cysteine S-methyltransferase [Rickettsiales bacterium TMED289]|nr:MAG: methylated-DNA--[protein]-cysteine S-methyltransferase [Rickettsiales bacterium TMED289]|tara:strand:- start:809 stop:1303 length:495 start_codon:yes stop_codon:yes gene_type:complete
MNQKIFQIPNFHFYFRILFNQDKLYELTFSEKKSVLIDRQLSLKIINNTRSKFGKEVKNQLSAYFNQKLTSFDIKTHYEGSEFSKKVFNEISAIPYGKTLSYKALAEKIKEPKSARAVGRASGSNKVPIIIPCHRVVGSKGELVGYSGGGGLLFKSYLQLLEKK